MKAPSARSSPASPQRHCRGRQPGAGPPRTDPPLVRRKRSGDAPIHPRGRRPGAGRRQDLLHPCARHPRAAPGPCRFSPPHPGHGHRSGAYHRAGRGHACDRDRPAMRGRDRRQCRHHLAGLAQHFSSGAGGGRRASASCVWTRIGRRGAGISISTSCSRSAMPGPRRSSFPRRTIPPAGWQAAPSSRPCSISRAGAASPSSATKSMALWSMTAAPMRRPSSRSRTRMTRYSSSTPSPSPGR